MSDLLPLFPLPNVVLFPNVFLPLHIFEQRYRDLAADAIATDRMIGMVLMRPGWERDYEGRPPVYPIGCSGVITHFERLSDGRDNIVLRGVERFKLLEEDHSRAYRLGVIEALREPGLAGDDRAALRAQRSKLESMLTPPGERLSGGPSGRQGRHEILEGRAGDPKITAAMSDEDLVNALAQYLDLEPLEKQALLEHHSLRSRAEALVELLEMKMLMARTPGLPNVAH